MEVHPAPALTRHRIVPPLIVPLIPWTVKSANGPYGAYAMSPVVVVRKKEDAVFCKLLHTVGLHVATYRRLRHVRTSAVRLIAQCQTGPTGEPVVYPVVVAHSLGGAV